MRKLILFVVLLCALGSAAFLAEADTSAADAGLTPASLAPGSPDVTQSVDLGSGYTATYDLSNVQVSGGPYAPTGCSRTTANVTYVYLGTITEWTMTHATTVCYASYKIQSVKENVVYSSSSCCGWSWVDMDYRYRDPEVLPASPVEFHAQGQFQWCAGPICIRTMHPGSIFRINGNGIVTGYQWWLG